MHKFFYAIIVLLLAVLFQAFAYASSNPPPKKIDCSGAFSESGAAASCTLDSVSVSGHNCQIGASCRSSAGGSFDTTNNVSVSENDARRLSNCSGTLRVGSC